MYTGAEDQLAVWGSASDDVHVAGRHGTLVHWDGASWTVTATVPATLAVLWGRAAADVFAAGGGVLLHWDGVAWLPVRSPSNQNVNAAWGRNSDAFFYAIDGRIHRLIGYLR